MGGGGGCPARTWYIGVRRKSSTNKVARKPPLSHVAGCGTSSQAASIWLDVCEAARRPPPRGNGRSPRRPSPETTAGRGPSWGGTGAIPRRRRMLSDSPECRIASTIPPPTTWSTQMTAVDEELFTTALGLEKPWFVERSEFDVESGRLDLHLSSADCRTFQCASCGADGCRLYDTRPPKLWRHLDFFGWRAILSAPAPRVTCPRCRGIRLAELSWTRPKTKFTRAFEHRIAELASRMPLRDVGEIVDEPVGRLERLVAYYASSQHIEDMERWASRKQEEEEESGTAPGFFGK